jgi:hypothetical protein
MGQSLLSYDILYIMSSFSNCMINAQLFIFKLHCIMFPIPDMLQQTRLFSASRILAFGYFDPVRPGCCGSGGAAPVQVVASYASYAAVGPACPRLWLLPRPRCHAVVLSPPHCAMAAVVYFFDSTVLGYFLVPLLSSLRYSSYLNIKPGLHEVPPFVLRIFSLKFLNIHVLVCLYCILH